MVIDVHLDGKLDDLTMMLKIGDKRYGARIPKKVLDECVGATATIQERKDWSVKSTEVSGAIKSAIGGGRSARLPFADIIVWEVE